MPSDRLRSRVLTMPMYNSSNFEWENISAVRNNNVVPHCQPKNDVLMLLSRLLFCLREDGGRLLEISDHDYQIYVETLSCWMLSFWTAGNRVDWRWSTGNIKDHVQLYMIFVIINLFWENAILAILILLVRIIIANRLKGLKSILDVLVSKYFSHN